MTDHRDPATIAAVEFRDELLEKGWRDDRGLAALSGNAAGPRAAVCAIQARAIGALLGVWSEPRHCFIYPDFQFHSSGAIRKEVAELLAVLPANEDDRGGWRRAFWLYSPHARLGGQTPADVFVVAPMSVIEAAREEFLGDPQANW